VKITAKAPVRIDFAGGTTDIYPYTKKHEGFVLNAGINRYVYGSLITQNHKTMLEYHADIPTSSGLGTSSVMNVVWLALTTKVRDKLKLAEMAYRIERATSVVGGKQDEYLGAFGKINLMRFKGEKPAKVEQLKLNPKFIKELESKLFLYYTGPRSSSKFNDLVISRIVKGDKKTYNTLNQIGNLAKSMKKVLMKKDLIRFSEMLNEEWELRKGLHKDITNKKLENKINFAKKHGAFAAKVCGAGGGGCILFYADNKKELIRKMGSNVIDFKFDNEGLVVKGI
jgi:D-glycero-alpha-D-manno-heptose-7-phosphate kinase